LSWRRTALSVFVGTFAVARLVSAQEVLIGVGAVLVGLGWSADLLLTSHRRYRLGLRLIQLDGEEAVLSGALDLARTALACAALGCGCLAFVVSLAALGAP
jgi:hypothetical protein